MSTTPETTIDESAFPEAARTALATAREETRLARLDSARIAAAVGAGLPLDDAKRIKGETAEELIADAAEFAAWIDARRERGREGSSDPEGDLPDADAPGGTDALIAALTGRAPEREARDDYMATADDFDGGVRETAPAPSDPSREHGAFIAALLTDPASARDGSYTWR